MSILIIIIISSGQEEQRRARERQLMDEGRYWGQKCQYGGDGDDDGHDGDGDGDKDKVYEQEYVADQESRGA